MATYDARPESHRVNAGKATAWLSGGWKLFMAAPGIWLAIGLIAILYLMLASVPGAGSLVATVMYPVIAAGMMECARVLHDGGALKFDTLFVGFRRNTGSLLVTGLLLLAGSIISFTVWGIIVLVGGGMAALTVLQSALNNGFASAADIIPFAGSLLLAMFVMLVLMTLLVMAAWFAPPLVFFDGMAPLSALKSSFFACLRSWLPLTIYGLLLFLLLLVAMVTVIGLLVVVPVVAASAYLSYRDIFH